MKIMLTDKIVCPKCGSTQFRGVDCYGIKDDDDDTYDCNKEVRVYYAGTCWDCGEEVQWDEVYQFVGYDFEVV